MSSIDLSVSQQGQAIAAAAKKYGIPATVLVGVYGKETSYGADIKNSGAGAVGPFQFLPSTASGYDYPLTNSPTAAQFQQQADAAAHYLATLFSQHGNNWDAALKAYSGGGYGAQQVATAAANAPIDLTAAVSPTTGSGYGSGFPGGTIGGAINTVDSTAQSAGQIATLLTSSDFWIRLGEGILGVLLLILGLRALTGGDGNPVTSARRVARHVR